MDESMDKLSTKHGKKVLNPFAVKPKKRSLVERELETNMTARITSPVTVGEGVSTSRYGRARRIKAGNDNRNFLDTLKSPKSENTPVKVQSPITKQVANSPYKAETPKKALETSLDNIDNTYQANKSLNCFKNEVVPKNPPAKKFSKVYIRKDLIQNRDDDDDIILIKDLFSPKSGKKLNKAKDRSSEKYNSSLSKQNGHIENASVVKALDFDGNKKDPTGNNRDSSVNNRDSSVNKRDTSGNKRDSSGKKRDSSGNKRDSSGNKRDSSGNKRDSSGNKRDSSGNKRDSSGNKRDAVGNKKNRKENDSQLVPSIELFKGEATCSYQVGDLAWARMGTFPFWPCIITRDPESDMFVRKKLFGRVEHDILHVTFFADNGRRSWVVDNMLREYMGLEEFLSTREKFTPEDKKKDPRLYSAFFISEKKQSLWNASVEEAEIIRSEPKSLRIDFFNELLHRARASKKQLKSGKVTRTDSDVSLSESLYDSLFSEDDTNVDDPTRSRNKSRNRSLDVSDVVTACLDNMAVKTGNIKIQRQSHMDRWLQKAKSKTPEKANKTDQVIIPKVETVTPVKVTPQTEIITPSVEKVTPRVEKPVSNNKKKKLPPKEVKITKVYSLRRSYESQNALIAQPKDSIDEKTNDKVHIADESIAEKNKFVEIECVLTKKEPIIDITNEKTSDNSLDDKIDLLKDKKSCNEEDNDDVLNAINAILEDSSAAASTDVISNPPTVNGETSKEINVEKLAHTDLNQDIKPEIMDVDEMKEIKDQNKPAVITEIIIDSPVKTEKETSIKDNLVNGCPVMDCSSPVMSKDPDMESKSSEIQETNQDCTETISTTSESLTNLYLVAKEDEIEIISRSSNVLDQTTLQSSPILKPNEMVSIPDNCSMTDDDESNSITLVEYNADMIDLQDHNSNLTNISTKTKSSTARLIEKEIINEEKEIDTNLTENQDILTICDMPTEKIDISCEKLDIQTEKVDLQTEEPVLPIETHDMSIDNIEDEEITKVKDILNESGQSASILQIYEDSNDLVSDQPKVTEESAEIYSNSSAILESLPKTCIDEALELNTIEMNTDKNEAPSNNIESIPFLGDSSDIDVYKDTATKDNFFREVNMNKPPDLTIESIAAKADLLNVQNNDSDYEDSDDEPSPEYEPLGDEITEDFRQHMKCIESSITDKKDEAQLVKVCNEIAIIEESKAKLADVISLNKISSNASLVDSTLNFSLEDAQRIIKEEKIKEESEKRKEVKPEKIFNENIEIDLNNHQDDLTKDTKAEIQDGLNIINKAFENSLKSPLEKKKLKLSLKKDTSKYENAIGTKQSVLNHDDINPRYKTIDQIEEIMKSKPKRLPIENGEVSIPEIKENGYHLGESTPDQYDDDDFDIDDASVNSEDSEVSLPHEKVPARRSLRSRPVKKGGLEDPEFLMYMELRQDDLMEQHPELSMDDIVLYLFKTYTYTKSDVIDEDTPLLKSVIKQETPPSRKKSKKATQPKNTIENFFREKYKKAKTIDFDSERSESAGTSDTNEYVKPKREQSISPVDSGIGNSKDSNEIDTPIKRKTKSKSPQIDTRKVTKEVKVELINDAIDTEDCSPKTPKRIRKKRFSPRVIETGNTKLSPEVLEKSMNNRWPVVVISPIKDERMEIKRDTATELKYDIETTHKQENIKKLESVIETKRESIVEAKLELDKDAKCEANTENIHVPDIVKIIDPEEAKQEPVIETKQETDIEIESMDSDSEIPLRQLRSKVIQENKLNELKREILELKDEIDDTASVSSDNEPLLKLKPKKVDKSIEGSYEDPEFLKYLELKQDNIIDENPQLSQNEMKAYLYKTWIYETDSKSDIRKNDDIESSNLVKGLNQETAPTRKKRKPKTETLNESEEIIPKDKPRRKTVSRYYNEAFLSDIEDELEVFEIFKTKDKPITVVSKPDSPKKETVNTEMKKDDTVKNEMEEVCEEINTLDEIELYFKQLTSPKPSVFKGLIREKVCEICEDIANLIKCKGCNGTFHYECVKKAVKTVETPTTFKGRRKKKKVGRKPKNLEDSDNSDEQNISEENISMEEIPESITIDAMTLESQLEAKMKEILDKETQLNYDSYSSDDGIDWTDTLPGKCELIDVKLKRRTPPIDYTNFRCNNCQKYDTPVCFVCKSAVSKTDVKIRQKCNVAHCYCYYHLECLDHWPQTQFNAGEWSRSTKKTNEQFEALTCPRHVCHTCVSDDPRGCKTRFSGDKLAKCVRCPATYHSFNKCLPAGTQILTASLIICPRHYEHRPGKVPCHVNTGWCFICALGGSLICCEYCPTSFHAECLNIKPPEGNYMCEDCETGRLPLYGEMVWVKLGHYRWWPGVILHPSEIPDNIMAVKHGLGEFVVRFFGQYDHYWVNRGRVFPYQEGDSGRISSQKSKIDVAFTTAMEHAQRAFEILKNAVPDEEESLDIASSLLPPHYIKLKCNKPIGSLLGRKIEDPSLSLTQCECSPAELEPCGPNSQCINRMLLTECGPTCRAGDRCSNRAFEKRLYPKLTPYRASHRGWGLKTLQDIKAGQFVIEYVGELIDEEEFQRRMRRKHEIRDENFYFLTLDKERMIDAGPKGNLARFMNHCCEPNCETQKWTVLGDVRVGLFAIDDIKANSEVTFNYNLECTGIEKKRCLCGAKRCSGYIGAKPKQLDESQRKKNGTLTAKRKYTKRKNLEEPSTNKNKVKKPLGRPPKPKELTEIEKDLLIITTAAISESRCQSVEEKNLKPLKKKTDPNTTAEESISSEQKLNSEHAPVFNGMDSKDSKLDSNSKEEGSVPNGMVHSKEASKTLKRKFDLISTGEVTISSAEPCAKRIKCDKQIEVGD